MNKFLAEDYFSFIHFLTASENHAVHKESPRIFYILFLNSPIRLWGLIGHIAEVGYTGWMAVADTSRAASYPTFVRGLSFIRLRTVPFRKSQESGLGRAAMVYKICKKRWRTLRN